MPDPGRDLISPAQHYKSRRVGPRSGTIMRAQLGGGHNICIILFYFSLWATNSALKKDADKERTFNSGSTGNQQGYL